MSSTPTEPTPIQDGDAVFLDMPGGVTYAGKAYLTDDPNIITVVLDSGFEGLWPVDRVRRA